MRGCQPDAILMVLVALLARLAAEEDGVVGEGFDALDDEPGDALVVAPPSTTTTARGAVDFKGGGASYFEDEVSSSPTVEDLRRSFPERRSLRKTSVVGGKRILECDISYPHGVYMEHIITWRKTGTEVPIFIQFNGYPPHVDAGFQDRIRLVEQASIEISDIQRKDEGWYECSIVFLGSSGTELESGNNGTWIHLTVHVLPKLVNASPSSILLEPGASLNLVCEGTGNPVPTGTWSKDGRTLVSSDRIQIRGSGLTIRSIRGSDGGLYTCILRNIVGHVSHLIKVIVEGNVYIITPPKNTTVFEGGRARFTCQADGFPANISYSWYHGNVLLNSLDEIYRPKFSVFSNGTLILNDVARDLSGWYHCQPSNGRGVRPKAAAYLNVTFLPRVSGMPVQLLVTKGLSGQLDCPVEANPPITLIVWSKNERMIDMKRSSNMHISKQGSLYISSIDSADEGRYSCTPYSPIGAGESSAPVQVIVKEPPHFVIRPDDIYQREIGQSVVMPCIADGDPTPTIAWHKVEGDLPDERAEQGFGNLTIFNLEEGDEGVFECVATSVISSVVTAALLLMEVRGIHSAYNVSVVTTTSTAAVAWLPAYHEGLVHQYVLWYKCLTSYQDGWTTLQVFPEDRYCVTVYHLHPGSLYQFMVLARSHESSAELFSATVNATTKGDSLPFHEVSTLQMSSSMNLLIPSSGDQLNPIAGTALLPPTNVTASKLPNGSFLISWQTPNDLLQAVDHYSVQYRTTGQWTSLAERIQNASSFVWSSSARGLSYHFQVLSHSNGVSSRPSRMASIQAGDRSVATVNIYASNVLMSIVIGSVSFLFLAIFVVVVSIHVFRAKKHPELEAQYANVKYYYPHTTDSNSDKRSGSRESNRSCRHSNEAFSGKDAGGHALQGKTGTREFNYSEVRGRHETPI